MDKCSGVARTEWPQKPPALVDDESGKRDATGS